MRKHPSEMVWELNEQQRLGITGFDDANPVSRSLVVGCFEFISRNAVGAEESQRSDRSNHTWLHSQQ
jgi:hypothetical protein